MELKSYETAGQVLNSLLNAKDLAANEPANEFLRSPILAFLREGSRKDLQLDIPLMLFQAELFVHTSKLDLR